MYGLVHNFFIVSISFIVSVERWQNSSSFGFLSVGLCVGKNQMCLNVRWLSFYNEAQLVYNRNSFPHLLRLASNYRWITVYFMLHNCIFYDYKYKLFYYVSNGLMIFFKLFSVTWVYISVVLMLLCPNNSWIYLNLLLSGKK